MKTEEVIEELMNPKVVDTGHIRDLLGDRPSMALKREDLLSLLDAYDAKKCTCPGELPKVMHFPSEFDAKH